MVLEFTFHKSQKSTQFRRCAMCLQNHTLWSRDTDFLLAKASRSIYIACLTLFSVL